MSSAKRYIALAFGLLAVVAFAGPGSSQTGPTPASGEELGHVRYEHAESQATWTVTTNDGLVSRAILFQRDVKAPESADTVDIVATVTMDHRVSSRGDRGDVRIDAFDGTNDLALRPGAYPYGWSGGSTDTSTFVWSRRAVPAAGETYSFQLETGVHDGPDSGSQARASGRRVSIVIEMWPSE